MKSTKAASRYAKALLEIAIDQKKVDSILGDMNFISQVSTESNDFTMMLSSPIVKSDKKQTIFNIIFDQFEKESKDFIQLVLENRREEMLPAIAIAFDTLVKEYRGIVPITIVSAIKLEEATKEAILARVKAAVEGDLEVTEEIDKSLIGGFLVKMGDLHMDATVSNQFNNLKQRLTR